MKSMKKLITMLLCALVAGALYARPVKVDEAKALAWQFWQTIPGSDKVEGALVQKDMGFAHIYFFVHSSGRGYVVMSADDCAEPILAYSLDAPTADTLNAELRWWFEGYEHQIAGAVHAGRPSLPDYHKVADMLLDVTLGDLPASVSPLLTTQWDQWDGYNDSCPLISGEHALTGCVATATAQLMKYWNHPYRGTNSTMTFSDVNLATVYDWAHMPNALTSVSSDVEKAAVAQLMFHVGRAVNMSYGLVESGAYVISSGTARLCAERALYQHFGYSRNIVSLSRGCYSDSQWLAIVKGELSAGRPVLYGGEGFSGAHAFVCDGYDAEDRLHFNWGWSGWYDGYFASTALRPGSGGSGSNSDNNYTMNQEIVINVYPEWTVGLPFSEDFSIPEQYWTGSLAGGDTLRGPLVALTATAATLTWQATGSATYSILVDSTAVYSGSDASGSVSLAAYVSSNPRISIAVASGSLAMESLSITDGSSQATYLIKKQNDTGGSGNAQTTVQFDSYYKLTANPSSGYHFSHWDDGCPWNPRYVYAAGDRTYTAYYEPDRVGDTLRFDNGAYTGYATQSSQTISIGRSHFRNNSQLTAIMYYPIDSGSYTIYIPNRQGSDTLFAKTVYPINPGMWNTCYLNNELFLDSTQWYTIYVKVNHSGRCYTPAFCGNSSGNCKGIRCIFDGLFNPRQLTVVGGSGSGLFLSDTTVVITADQENGGRFLGWNDGNTDNPRTVRVVSDTTFIATYSKPSKIYVRYASNDTTLGRVEGQEGWYEWEDWMTGDMNVSKVKATVVSANAHFSHWSDIPNTEALDDEDQAPMHRYVYLDSALVWSQDTVTITAFFEPVVHDDTLRFDDGSGFFSYSCPLGAMSHHVWGVRYDPSMLGRRDMITAVNLYANMVYQYDTVRVYQGGDNAPGTLLHTEVFQHQDLYYYEWETYTFSEPVAIDSTQAVWITISARDGHLTNFYDRSDVVLGGFYTGNSGGSWLYEPGTGWRQYTVVLDYGSNEGCNRRLSTATDHNPYHYGTWSIRAVMPLAKPSFTVTAVANDSTMGSVTGGGVYRQDATATLRATPYPGYRFLQWNDGVSAATRTITVTSDITYTAYFEALPTYTVTVLTNDSAMGGVSGGGSYYPGDSATLRATPYQGYRFLQWNDGVSAATRYITVTSDITYTAYFEAIPMYTITVVPNDSTMGSVYGGGLYAQYTMITISAIANEGYRFVSWQDDVTDETRWVNVLGDATYTATFEPTAVGIEDIAAGDVTICPNPARTTVKVSGLAGDATMQLVDVSGRVLFEVASQGGECLLHVERLVPGVYYVHVMQDGVTSVHKLIVR